MSETLVAIINIVRIIAASVLLVLVLTGGPDWLIIALIVLVSAGLLWSFLRGRP